jgi:hypothetical protein
VPTLKRLQRIAVSTAPVPQHPLLVSVKPKQPKENLIDQSIETCRERKKRSQNPGTFVSKTHNKQYYLLKNTLHAGICYVPDVRLYKEIKFTIGSRVFNEIKETRIDIEVCDLEAWKRGCKAANGEVESSIVVMSDLV